MLSLKLAPPAITEDDARRGILSLIERGLIPPAAQLTLDPSPVKNRIAPLHDPQDRSRPPQQTGMSVVESIPSGGITLASKSLTKLINNYQILSPNFVKWEPKYFI